MKNAYYAERVPTGIKGLDEAMSGGFVRDSINLIAGGPGSGKSIFALQYLIKGIVERNEHGVYLTFEERRDKLVQYMKNFGWDLEKFEKDNKLRIIEISPKDVRKAVYNKNLGLKYGTARYIKAKRVAIDSINAYSLLFPTEVAKREAHVNLFEMLRSWGVTVLLVAEYDVEEDKGSPLDFEVDGILRLYNFKKGDTRTRAIEIYKLRGSKHSTKTFPLEIVDKEGIRVYPEQNVF
ncbi:hypothetical protein A2641_00975 [Candidatus Nomurabacteria bacterium RIFCSPHIGHO2_01_FULL_37_25]|nr:hypothetical protein [Candidatus Woesearchaeota archaeon]OGI60879.1 MAG: hypothetical protein A2641_00975 [Candidatus Nomurabacteria bacterium RIFCSPHIGHO2_01_FULL_37_25]